jgi:hypothetical protein
MKIGDLVSLKCKAFTGFGYISVSTEIAMF